MCDSCADRAAQLRQLADCFETMAAQAGDPASTGRLRLAAGELAAAAGQLPADCARCGAGDVAWLDEPADAAAMERRG
jgi:hypothetical protein